MLCEQVIGRALRRWFYELNDQGLFNVEYADVLGIPFDFTAKPVIVTPQPPRETIHVKAMRPERDACEITFPRVQGYRTELPKDRLSATFNADSTRTLTPELVGATETLNTGIIDETADLNLAHNSKIRMAQVAYKLTAHLLLTRFHDADGQPQLNLFGQLKHITRSGLDQRPVLAALATCNPTGNSVHVNFTTSKTNLRQANSRRCHLNWWVILDRDLEGEFCLIAERAGLRQKPGSRL